MGRGYAVALVSALFGIALASPVSAAPQIQPWGLHLEYLDRAAKPGDNFYVYGNGRWLETAEIPADRPAAGAGLESTLRNDERLKAIVAGWHGRADLTEENRKLRISRRLHGHDADRGERAEAARRKSRGDCRAQTRGCRARAIPALRLGGPSE